MAGSKGEYTMMVLLYIAGNALFWLAVHFASGYLVHLFPETLYRSDAFPFRLYRWERKGTVYRRYLKIHVWKDRLPEAGEFFSLHPFNKSHLRRFDAEYLSRFMLETCRAELAHLLPFLFYPLCLPWNPWPANLIMFIYAVLANLPFIIIQRYNRARLLALPIFATRR
jgi:glycosyl-4,4'-diaponeurosporenoate acyltransferase